MASFTLRLNDKQEGRLAEIQKKKNIKTKNKAVAFSIERVFELERLLSDKIKECNRLIIDNDYIRNKKD